MEYLFNKIFNHSAIIAAVARGHTVEVSKSGVCIPRGFSKSGSCSFGFVDDKLVAHTRYGRETEIESYDDIVFLAWIWFIESESRGFSVPEEFKQDFIERGWIKVKSETAEKIIIVK